MILCLCGDLQQFDPVDYKKIHKKLSLTELSAKSPFQLIVIVDYVPLG